jgi:hypothetical protein
MFRDGSANLTSFTAPIFMQTTSTESRVVDSVQKGRGKIIAEKKEGNNGSSSEMWPCRDWRQGKCPRGGKCHYKHDMLRVRGLYFMELCRY